MPYIHHLLADFRRAREDHSLAGKVEVLDMEYSEGLLGRKPMGEWMGLDPGEFPPADYWNPQELTLLLKAFRDLWDAHGYAADFPKILHPRIRYQLYVEALSWEVPYPDEKGCFLHFCPSLPENCPFGRRSCRCRDEDNPSKLSIR
jgi:hypothetical protein